MSENNYQATVIGKDTIPVNPQKRKWVFLTRIIATLKPGQAIRLVLPKEQTTGGILSKWLRLTRAKGVYGHNRVVKQPDGSKIVYLWYENQQ